MSTSLENLSKQKLSEPDAHVLTRHMQLVIRGLLVLSLVATIVLFLFYRPAAYLAAIPALVLSMWLVIVGMMERRSRVSELRRARQDGVSQREIEVDVETAGIVMVLKVLGVLALGTFIVSAAFLDLSALGAGAAAIFLLAVLIQLPFLPLFFSEAARDEREKLTGKRD